MTAEDDVAYAEAGDCELIVAASPPSDASSGGTILPAFWRMHSSPGSVCAMRLEFMRVSEQVMKSVSGDWPCGSRSKRSRWELKFERWK